MARSDQDYESLFQLAARYGQEHVFRFWPSLNSAQRDRLLQQVSVLDFETLSALAERIKTQEKSAPPKLEPVQPIPIPRTEAQKQQATAARARGEEALRAGKVGAVLVAGGQGTRLGFDGPKGIFPIGPVSGKSLFQMHAEKIIAVRRRYKTTIPWYIMTSETNDAEEFRTRIGGRIHFENALYVE